MQGLHRVDCVHVRTEVTPECVAFLSSKLPSLRHLKLCCIDTLSLLQPLSPLTSIELSSYELLVKNFQPLATLSQLRKLHMECIHLPQRICFDSLTQLTVSFARAPGASLSAH